MLHIVINWQSKQCKNGKIIKTSLKDIILSYYPRVDLVVVDYSSSFWFFPMDFMSIKRCLGLLMRAEIDPWLEE